MTLRRLSLAVLLCLGSAAGSAEAQLRHLGVSPRDRLVECLERVFKKPVFYDPNIPRIEPPAGCTGLSPQQLKEKLRAQTIAFLEESEAGLLRSSLTLPPYDPRIGEASRVKWKHFQVKVSVMNASLQGGLSQRALSPVELSRLRREILAKARRVPVFQADGEPLDVAKATFPVRVEVYVRRLRPDAPISLVAVVRGEDYAAAGRVVYGEEGPRGTFKLLWDSPLFVARHLAVSFDDLDGDGFQEILLDAGFPAGMHDAAALTVFDRQGRELTRQRQCMQPEGYDFWPGHDTCPIVGSAVDVVYSPKPPFDVAASRVFFTDRDGLFRLKGGLYVEAGSPP